MGLECRQPVCDCVSVAEVRGQEHVSSNDRELDFDLVEPLRLDGRVHDERIGELFGERIECFLSAMRRAVVHDPEHPIGRERGRCDAAELDLAPTMGKDLSPATCRRLAILEGGQS